MDSQPVKDIEAALREMEELAKGSDSSSPPKKEKGRKKKTDKTLVKKKERDVKEFGEEKSSRKRVNPVTWFIKSVLVLATLIALPFLLLVRLTVYLHIVESFNIWMALASSIGATTIILLGYSAFLQKKLTGSWNISRGKVQILLTIVVIYCGYSLMYISGSNVTSDEVASTYLSLHPTLRLATSTLVLIDQDLVVTDMARTPEDYIRMGLPVLENSKHYKQESGFVEAVDIRTRDQQEWVNLLVKLYYRAMGFKTLRHDGTGDHLHVSMPRPS